MGQLLSNGRLWATLSAASGVVSALRILRWTRCPSQLNTLAARTRILFERTGNIALIHLSVALSCQAVRVTRSGDVELPGYFSSLGTSLLRRYGHTGDRSDIDEAVETLRTGVELTPEDDPYLPARLTQLGVSLERHFERTGENASYISDAISLHRRAAQLSEGHPTLYNKLNNLGIALMRQYDRIGDLPALQDAIEAQQRAASLLTDTNPDLPPILVNLGHCYKSRFTNIGHFPDLDGSILLYNRAMELTPDDHPRFPATLCTLGAALGIRFAHTGNTPDIEKALYLAQRAVQLCPEGHADRPLWLHELGLLFRKRFQRTGDDADIAEAIAKHQRASILLPPGHIHLPELISTLGCAYLARFDRSRDPSHLTGSISLIRNALDITPPSHPSLLGRLNDLASALDVLRYHSSELDTGARGASTTECIALRRRGLTLVPESHPLLITILNGLGRSLGVRGHDASDLSDLNESITLSARAVELAPQRHAYLPFLLNDLGRPLLRRFELTQDISDIKWAISALQKAVELTPLGHTKLPIWMNSIGWCYHSKFKSPHGSPEDLVSANTYFKAAANCDFGRPVERLGGAVMWARCIQRMSPHSPEVLDAFDTAMSLVALVAGLEHTIQAQYAHLRDISGVLAAEAAAAAFAHNRLDKALEWLEQGRCHVWKQLTDLRRPLDNLRAHDRKLAARVAEVSKQLDSAVSARAVGQTDMSTLQKVLIEDETRAHLALAREWTTLLAHVRAIQGFEDFIQPPTYSSLMSHLPPEGYVVLINVQDQRCDAIVLSAGMKGPRHVCLPTFSAQKADLYHTQLQNSLTSHHLRTRCEAKDRGIRPAPVGGRTTLQRILEGLWKEVTKPIIESLKLTKFDQSSAKVPPRIWWCPTGPLSFLPIRAAGVYHTTGPQDILPDYAISSYIPTVSSLIQRCKDQKAIPRKVAGILLTSQPKAPGAASISGTTTEVTQVYALAKIHKARAVKLEGDAVSPTECLKLMEDYSCVHLACHASQNKTDPLESRFLFHKGSLSLHAIIRQNLAQADLAYLSACQTSAGEARLSDEAVHLAAGMLAAGYRSVVATMWSIKDKHAPDVATDFYTYLWGKRAGPEFEFSGRLSAEALHHAVRQLRQRLRNTDQVLLEWIPYVHFG